MVIPETGKIEIYVNKEGSITIRQINENYEDDIVCVSKGNAAILSNYILRAAAQIKDLPDET